MTALPTEPGSVIGWMSRYRTFGCAQLHDDDMWLETGELEWYSTYLLDQRLRLQDASWWFLGRVTPDGITTTR